MTIDLEGLYPFDGDGHWHLCLDYRENWHEPRVTWISTESDSEKRIAGTFAEYLDQLTLEIDESFVLETQRTLPQIAQELEQALAIKWIGPDTWAHGYPIYRASWNGGVIWLSANEVPKGFIRPDEAGYEELKHKMEGKALRYPELPPTGLLLKVDDEAQEAPFRRVLAEKGIDLRLPRHYVK